MPRAEVDQPGGIVVRLAREQVVALPKYGYRQSPLGIRLSRFGIQYRFDTSIRQKLAREERLIELELYPPGRGLVYCRHAELPMPFSYSIPPAAAAGFQ